MASTLYGLPLLGQGESFLLRTTRSGKACSILVDGGFGAKRSSLHQTITREAPDLRLIDRFICTHEDADHCDGIPDFIREWYLSGRTIKEMWLPAIWSVDDGSGRGPNWIENRIVMGAFEAAKAVQDRLQDYTREWHDDDTITLSDRIRAAATDVATEFDVLEGLASPIGSDPEPGGSSHRNTDEDDEVDRVLDIIAHEEPPLAIFRRRSDRSFFRSVAQAASSAKSNIDRKGRFTLAQASALLAYDALNTHRRIGPIIAACIYHKILIRWFDFQRFANNGHCPHGGDRDFLTPVNAVEVARTKQRAGALRLFLGLTLSRPNVESLVFLKHETDDEPAALFTADSRLAFGSNRPSGDFPKPASGLPTRGPLLATAFHHGSATNDHGYGVLQSWLSGTFDPIYVRNGGDKIGSVAPLFCAAARQCVTCHGDARAPRLAKLEATAGSWLWPAHPIPCTCR